MGAAWYRTRSELRQRWRATLLLALMVGLVGGIVLTTVAGARRSSTAYERFRQETLAGDLDIAPSDPSEESFEAIAALPQVVALTRTAYPFIVPKGAGLYPFLDFLAVAQMDDAFGRTIDRPRLVAGRMPALDRANEMAVIEQFAREADLQVGDEVAFESYSPEQFEPLFTTGDAGPPAGPEVTLTVTGVVSAPDFFGESSGGFLPRAILPPAFLEDHGERMGIYPGGARVRLRDGAADLPAVMDAVRRLYPDDAELELQPASDFADKVDDSIGVLVAALLLCALCAALAGIVVLTQALARHLGQDPSAERGLAALGMSRRERAMSLVGIGLPAAIGGAVVAGVASVLASPLMPVGLARRAEPDLGLSVDGGVLGVGIPALALTVVALAGLAAWAATRAPVGEGAADIGPSRPSSVQRAMARVGSAPPSVVGAGMALAPGRGASATPVRSTLAGVTFGIGGVAAVVVFAASLSTLVDSPPRFGFPWHALVSGFQGDIAGEAGEELLADPRVRDAAALTTSLAHLGTGDVNIHAFGRIKGSAEPTLLAGTLPRGDDEVALGTATMRDAGVRIGDIVELQGPGQPSSLKVVGRVALPIVDDRSAVDRGAVLTEDALVPLASNESLNNDLLIGWADGVDVDAANEELAEATGAEVSGLRTPSEVVNLRLVRSIPNAMVAVLALLAVLAAVHALVTTVRRRRQDLAVLRSLGFVGRQLTSTLVTQATALGVVGLVIGVPLGVVVGRLAWRAVASDLGVVDTPSTPLVALVAVAAVALVVVNLAALRPARRARQIPAAAVLRTG